MQCSVALAAEGFWEEPNATSKAPRVAINSRVMVVKGTHQGRQGVVKKLTKVMVYVQLQGNRVAVCIMQMSVRPECEPLQESWKRCRCHRSKSCKKLGNG